MTNASLKSLVVKGGICCMVAWLKSESLADGLHHLGVFFVGEIYFSGIHAECASLGWPVEIFGCNMEVQV